MMFNLAVRSSNCSESFKFILIIEISRSSVISQSTADLSGAVSLPVERFCNTCHLLLLGTTLFCLEPISLFISSLFKLLILNHCGNNLKLSSFSLIVSLWYRYQGLGRHIQCFHAFQFVRAALSQEPFFKTFVYTHSTTGLVPKRTIPSVRTSM